MFESYKKNYEMIEGAYIKLKSYFYYNKNMLFNKKKIAIFESDKKEVEAVLFALSKVLNEPLNEKNIEYIDNLVDKISFITLQKSFCDIGDNNDEIVIENKLNNDKKLESVNFFIDAPVELLILDVLWILLFSRLVYDSNGFGKCSYGNILEIEKLFKRKYNGNYSSDEAFLKKIIFNRTSLFKPYYRQYTTWRDNAFETVETIHNRKKNSLLISLDFKGFFYNIDFNFSELYKYIDERHNTILNNLKFLTDIIEKTYRKYTEIITEFRVDVNANRSNVIFPIGLLSTLVLANIYSKEIDESIENKLFPSYYGRYVDDILIVLQIENLKDITKSRIINDFFVKNKIFIRSEDQQLSFISNQSFIIQESKVNCFYFDAEKPKTLIDLYNNKIKFKASEANLIPNIYEEDESFINFAYSIENITRGVKVRDIGFLSYNNFLAIRYIQGLIRSTKNNREYNTSQNSPNLLKQCNHISVFYSGTQSLEFSSAWQSIFYFAIINNLKEFAEEFYRSTIETIDKLSHDDGLKYIRGEYSDEVLENAKLCIKEELDIAYCLALALDLNFTENQNKKELALILRKSNLFNDKLTSFPLINYSRSANDPEFSLLQTDLNKMYFHINEIQNSLDEFKKKYAPRFIHIDELSQYLYLLSFQKVGNIIGDKTNDIIDRFCMINHIKREHISLNAKSNNEIYNNQIIDIKYPFGYLRNFHRIKINNRPNRIALANIFINESDCIQSLQGRNFKFKHTDKKRLFSLLKIALEHNVKFIVFPEFYLPISWISELTDFSKKTQICIISGLQYVRDGYRAINNIVIIQPFLSRYGYRNSIPLIREKNDYSPLEKIELSKLGFVCMDSEKPFNYLINWEFTSYSTLLCYELTDIFSRCNLKGLINILFTPEFNRDTNYFSNIVDSSSRDLYCFIAQSNTSKYGDSRITAPYKTVKKDIIRVKAGENDVMIIGNVNIGELEVFNKEYKDRLKSVIENNLIPENENKDMESKTIKPPPPRYP